MHDVIEGHQGELTLRRFYIGELTGEAAGEVRVHLEGCEACRARVEALRAEERAFREHISYERFAAGVEQAARPRRERRGWVTPGVVAAGTLAAAAMMMVLVATPDDPTAPRPAGRVKGGGPQIELYVGGEGTPSRPAARREPLSRGERVRIAYQPGRYRFVTVVSVDEDGGISALYPEMGPSLAVEPVDDKTRLLPGSVEFTGPGLERIIVVFTEEPLEVDEVADRARAAWEAAGGRVESMPDLDLEGAQRTRVVIKP